jgi:hypothetical protein
MILSAQMLDNVASVNSFEATEAVCFVESDPQDVYLQLVDLTKHFRYMPAAGATLQVVVDNIDDGKKITRFATQPFSQDPSIWKLTIMASDSVRGTVNLRLTLTEGSAIRRGQVQAALRVSPKATI